jgi:hypothetical protein
MLKHANNSHMISTKKIHPSQILYQYKLHFIAQLLKKMKDFLTPFFFNICK